MAIEYAIRTLALGDAQITATVGTRWYPSVLPENPTLPAIVYQQISQVNYSSHQGNSNLAVTRIQLTLWTMTYDLGYVLKEHLKRVLRDYKGVVGSDRIDRIIWANDISQNDPLTRFHQRIIDLLVMHYVQY